MSQSLNRVCCFRSPSQNVKMAGAWSPGSSMDVEGVAPVCGPRMCRAAARGHLQQEVLFIKLIDEYIFYLICWLYLKDGHSKLSVGVMLHDQKLRCALQSEGLCGWNQVLKITHSQHRRCHGVLVAHECVVTKIPLPPCKTVSHVEIQLIGCYGWCWRVSMTAMEVFVQEV